MNVKYYVRALLCLYLTILLPIYIVHAQALKVGDTLSQELWSMPLRVINHPEGKETITLSEYEDKLIILDFWATWCGSCIKSLDKMDSLQKEFAGKLVVIPITYESAIKAIPLILKRGLLLPSVVNDSILKQFFPHESIPHQVWIKDSSVMAITGPAYTFRENIENVLKNKEVKIVMKEEEDPHFDPKDIIIPSETSFMESGLLRKTRFSGTRMGISSHGFYYYNTSIRHLFIAAYRNQFPFINAPNRIIVEASDPWKVNFPPKPTTTEEAKRYEKWKQENMYTYYLRFAKPQTRETILKMAQSDLQNYFEQIENLTAVVEKRKTLCLILKPSANRPQAYKAVNTFGIRDFVDLQSSIPVIDETGNPLTRTPLNYENIPVDYENLKVFFSSLGIDLTKEYRNIEMMIIKDKQQ